MKKLKFLGMAAAGLVLLTSCMDGKNEQIGRGVGLVDYSYKIGQKLVYVGDGSYPIYMSKVAEDIAIEAGDCIFFNFTLNWDQPENANAAANGYVVATYNNSAILSKGETYYQLQDTATVLPDELLISEASFQSVPLKSDTYEKIALGAIYEKSLTDQKNSYYLSWGQTPSVIEGNNVYTLYLRSVKREDGKAPTLEDRGEMVAFDFGSFMSMATSQEKAAGKKQLNMRIAYAKKFNSDSTKVAEWGMSQILPQLIRED